MNELPVAYSINHEGLVLDIALIETNKVLIHEDTIPDKLFKLEKKIEQRKAQTAPIIVDRNSLVVLDGMHRTKVMKRLGTRFICVCLVDYQDPSITVNRWCRIIPKTHSKSSVDDLLASINLTPEPYSINIDPEKSSELILTYKDSAFKLVSTGEDLVKLFRSAYELELLLNSKGYQVEHCTESEAKTMLSEGMAEAAIYPPRVSKEDIVDLAERGKVFTPKATRHKLPARPLRVNVPLSLLKNTNLTVEEVNLVLREYLMKKKLVRINPGRSWRGQTYDETLYVFKD